MATTSDPAVQSAARWFWWIAGLSLVNAVLFHSGSDTNFVVGLAMTLLASVLFANLLPVAILLIAITVGFYFLVGFYAQRHKLWAFYVGLGVYVVDALIYIGFQDWMSVAFHALAAFFIFRGITRVKEIARIPSPAPTGA